MARVHIVTVWGTGLRTLIHLLLDCDDGFGLVLVWISGDMLDSLAAV